jgi:hypothetical protein
MRKRIKMTGFKDWDSMFYNNFLSIPVLLVFSILLEDWSMPSLIRNLYVSLIFPTYCADSIAPLKAEYSSYQP